MTVQDEGMKLVDPREEKDFEVRSMGHLCAASFDSVEYPGMVELFFEKGCIIRYSHKVARAVHDALHEWAMALSDITKGE